MSVACDSSHCKIRLILVWMIIKCVKEIFWLKVSQNICFHWKLSNQGKVESLSPLSSLPYLTDGLVPQIAAGTSWWIRFGSNNGRSRRTIGRRLDLQNWTLANALCQSPYTNNQPASKDSLHSPRPNGFWWNFIKHNCEIVPDEDMSAS